MTHLLRNVFSVMAVTIFPLMSAQDVEAMSEALGTLYEQVAFVDGYKTYCDTAVPDSTATNTQAVTTWKTANNVSQIEQVVTQFSALSPEIAQSFQSISTEFQTVFAKRFVGIEAQACGDLPRLLAGEDSSLTTLYPQEMQLLPSMAEMLGQTDTGQTDTGQTDTGQTDSGQAPSGQTSPLSAEDAPEPGQYSCTTFKIDSDENPGEILETSEGFPANFDLFANGEYSYHDAEFFVGEYGLDTQGMFAWPEETGFYSFHYNPDRYDPGYTSLDWLTGELASEIGSETDISEYYWSEYGDRPSSFYVGDNGHTEIFLKREDSVYWEYETICTWTGPNGRRSPTEAMQATETPENYLQPASVTSPAPTGTGGLSGLYLGEDGTVIYFLPNGYFYNGVYRWGFDTLDQYCGRVWKPGAFGRDAENVCDTYLLQASSGQEGGLQLGERVPESQQDCETVTKQSLGTDGNLYYDYSQQCSPVAGYDYTTDGFLPFSQNADGTLTIEDVLYSPIEPEQNLSLDGTYEYNWSSINSSIATGGSEGITFTPDGKFIYQEDSYLGGSFDQGPYTDTISSINSGQNPNTGTYSINGYAITLNFSTGLTLNYSFLRSGPESFLLLYKDFGKVE
jgi:hypothetical protein